MSKLSAFLHPAITGEEKEIIVSKRFLDEKGNPVKFKIKAISQAENEIITKAATKTSKVNGEMVQRLDRTEFSRRLVVAGTVEPDFSSKDMCDAYGVMDPLMVPGKMLYSGEYSMLLTEIMKLSGFNSEEDINEEAKN